MSSLTVTTRMNNSVYFLYNFRNERCPKVTRCPLPPNFTHLPIKIISWMYQTVANLDWKIALIYQRKYHIISLLFGKYLKLKKNNNNFRLLYKNRKQKAIKEDSPAAPLLYSNTLSHSFCFHSSFFDVFRHTSRRPDVVRVLPFSNSSS